MESVVRVLPFSRSDGATNMAADDVMLRTAVDGTASLRFYGWTSATVSLGYFQAAAVRETNPLLAALPWVRRPSGGATLVHHHELTYALALPPGTLWQAEPWMPRMHRIITRALADLGVRVDAVVDLPIKHGDILCFQQHTPGDLLCAKCKVVGSAQRKYRGALMQHGSILLAQSEYAPELAGIKELTAVVLDSATVETAICQAFAAATGSTMCACHWTEQEKNAIRDLAEERYLSAAWNERR